MKSTDRKMDNNNIRSCLAGQIQVGCSCNERGEQLTVPFGSCGARRGHSHLGDRAGSGNPNNPNNVNNSNNP